MLYDKGGLNYWIRLRFRNIIRFLLGLLILVELNGAPRMENEEYLGYLKYEGKLVEEGLLDA